MGMSGAGKSTALRTLVALHPFTRGDVTIGDVSLHSGRIPPERMLRALRRSIGLVFQAPSLFAHMTALDNVTLAPIHALGVTVPEAQHNARELLAELGVAHRADAYPHQLSGGEAQRVAIARALAPDPQILLMDEPTAALDPARRTALGQTLRQLAREGRGLVVATHDVDFAEAFADNVAVLAEGYIVEEGPARAVLGSPNHDATRKLLHHNHD
jgi:ABC-type polar amino acid transport system ATPase subunit